MRLSISSEDAKINSKTYLFLAIFTARVLFVKISSLTHGLPCSDFEISFCCPVADHVTCETAHCDENEWCLETAEGPLCKCGDDDFNDDHDAYDFTRHEDGECIENVEPGVDVNGTITIERGECSEFGYEWTFAMSKDTPADGGDFEFIHSFS
jgi:hypothetical protein